MQKIDWKILEDIQKIWGRCLYIFFLLSHSFTFNVYMVVFLFNTVIYVFLLLCLIVRFCTYCMFMYLFYVYIFFVCLCIFIVPAGTLRLP
jgi:hypothetical protein